MNVTVRYTQPKFHPNQIQKTTDHIVECHETETLPNGKPKPINESINWLPIFSSIDELPMYEILE